MASPRAADSSTRLDANGHPPLVMASPRRTLMKTVLCTTQKCVSIRAGLPRCIGHFVDDIAAGPRSRGSAARSPNAAATMDGRRLNRRSRRSAAQHVRVRYHRYRFQGRRHEHQDCRALQCDKYLRQQCQSEQAGLDHDGDGLERANQHHSSSQVVSGQSLRPKPSADLHDY